MMTRDPSENDFPWWLVILGVTGAWLFYEILSDADYHAALKMLAKGIGVTLMVALVGFLGACVLGLALATMGLSDRLWLRQIARLYIEIMRGVPIIVLLLYVAFVLAPAGVSAVNWGLSALGLEQIRGRDFPLLWRAVIALMLAYSAFLAEIFRAGIQSVDKGQIEAGQALGLGPWQRFRLIILPQGLRTILPPLGNDFVAMLKDSSLVSVLGVSDIAQLAKVTAAGNFRYFETYNVAAFLYLTMTIGLSLILRKIEKTMRQDKGR